MTSEVTQDAFAKDDNGISDADCIGALLKEYAGDRRREGFPKTADTLQRGADLLTEASHRLQSHRLTAQSGEGEREALREALVEAYRKGATDVHNYWVNNPGEPPRGDPEFGESASDYAAAALDIFDSAAALRATDDAGGVMGRL